MKIMNVAEMHKTNAGGYWGKKFTCSICGRTKRYWDWKFIFWNKSTCQDWVESMHYRLEYNSSSKVHG